MELEQHNAPAPNRDGLINNAFYWAQKSILYFCLMPHSLF